MYAVDFGPTERQGGGGLHVLSTEHIPFCALAKIT
jgi:hypothetical protein